ncbi:uncharacterized protein PHACADRAFT_257401 [Phanerochaete carnosa HHB-10118-sp]|uniref:Uncharacterized protein n=1 Tax=Phanerochaete carnosa (strain HHB-10118-sp) TaxID=650164 RepID=K5W456_PHACS|nr:uncharacterized protein PHACADRAFT_257401 [Phanerochaete carnosa HHB-10118-sp]EKM53910.1 hypothetical protein PHACADRAFT_257401 [Phanerochaete carnosa HHB-10118-sp]
MQSVGQNLRAFYYLDGGSVLDSGISRLPILSACTSMTSVTLTTSALSLHADPDRLRQTLVFLASLPAAICRMRLELKYYESWTGKSTLAPTMQEVNWAAISRALEAYANLAALEIGVQCFYCAPNCTSLADDVSVQAAVLERFPARLRAVAIFI